jgi:hypothetical protein
MRNLATLAVLQLGVILGWAGYHEHVRASAPTFRIPLQPVDPYDVIRGRYFRLNPLDGSLKTGHSGTPLDAAAAQRIAGSGSYYHGPLLVGFCPLGDVYRVCDLRRIGDDGGTTPARAWSRARATVSWQPVTYGPAGKPVSDPGWFVMLDLGLDRFFLPNRTELPGREIDTGWELEVSHRPAQPLLPLRLWFRGQPVRTER